MLHRFVILSLAACLLMSEVAKSDSPATYVDSAAIRERFDKISDTDLEALRGKRILLVSRSFGLNLHKGLTALAHQDKKYDIVSSYVRYDVFKAGGNVGIISGDAVEKANFLHILGTYWPHTKRLDELDAVLSQPPHEFGDKVDAVVVFYHTATPTLFEPYKARMAAWRKAFPKTHFLYVTSGFMGPKYSKENEASHAFGEKIRSEFRGRVPLYDMAAILSDDFRSGHVYCPEYSKDPAEVHPNAPAGEAMLAKGFLLALVEAFRTAPPVPEGTAAVPVATPAAASLPDSHPDVQAVRTILDANGLRDKKVSGVSVVQGGRIVELFLQEGGIRRLPDEIGTLTALRKLHLYGDRSLALPLLEDVSPQIARCTALEELLLNQNALTSLPPEISALKNLRNLSIGDNFLIDLPEPVASWAKKYDPKGTLAQNPPPNR